MLRPDGNFVYPVPRLTEVRVVVGTAALLAVAAVLALALGAILRRSAGAVAAVIVLIVLPYILAIAAVLPAGAGAVAAAAHPGRRVRHPAEHPGVPAGRQRYTPTFGLLPARAVGRVRGAVRLTGAGPRPGVVLLRRRDV